MGKKKEICLAKNNRKDLAVKKRKCLATKTNGRKLNTNCYCMDLKFLDNKNVYILHSLLKNTLTHQLQALYKGWPIKSVVGTWGGGLMEEIFLDFFLQTQW